jgi:hypothetical protein
LRQAISHQYPNSMFIYSKLWFHHLMYTVIKRVFIIDSFIRSYAKKEKSITTGLIRKKIVVNSWCFNFLWIK